jgi:hypothetical protein
MDSESRHILRRAQEKLLAAEQEVTKWAEFIRQFMELAHNDIGGSQPSSVSGEMEPGKRRVAPEVEQSVQAGKAFITRLGRPATLSELYDEMLRLGVPVGGKDPKATLDSRLRYSGEFQTGRGLGWWFAGQPYPNALAVAASRFSPERISEIAESEQEVAEPPWEVSHSGSE